MKKLSKLIRPQIILTLSAVFITAIILTACIDTLDDVGNGPGIWDADVFMADGTPFTGSGNVYLCVNNGGVKFDKQGIGRISNGKLNFSMPGKVTTGVYYKQYIFTTGGGSYTQDYPFPADDKEKSYMYTKMVNKVTVDIIPADSIALSLYVIFEEEKPNVSTEYRYLICKYSATGTAGSVTTETEERMEYKYFYKSSYFLGEEDYTTKRTYYNDNNRTETHSNKFTYNCAYTGGWNNYYYKVQVVNDKSNVNAVTTTTTSFHSTDQSIANTANLKWTLGAVFRD